MAYRTVAERDDYTGAQAKFSEEGADLVTFTSSSTAEHFFALGLPWPEGCAVASIGPVTSTTLRDLGHRPDAEAVEHDIPRFVRVILEYFGR